MHHSTAEARAAYLPSMHSWFPPAQSVAYRQAAFTVGSCAVVVVANTAIASQRADMAQRHIRSCQYVSHRVSPNPNTTTSTLCISQGSVALQTQNTCEEQDKEQSPRVGETSHVERPLLFYVDYRSGRLDWTVLERQKFRQKRNRRTEPFGTELVRFMAMALCREVEDGGFFYSSFAFLTQLVLERL